MKSSVVEEFKKALVDFIRLAARNIDDNIKRRMDQIINDALLLNEVWKEFAEREVNLDEYIGEVTEEKIKEIVASHYNEVSEEYKCLMSKKFRKYL